MAKFKSLACIVVAGSLFGTQAAKATDGTWISTANGNWSDATKWSTNPVVPGGAGSTVSITANITGNATVTIDTTSRTVGTLNIGDTNNTNSYTLAGSSASLILDNNGAGAAINELSTSKGDTISAPITLNDNVAISNASANTLTISGAITGASKTLSYSGVGVLALTGTNTFSGATTINSGEITYNNSSMLTSSAITVASGATAQVNGFLTTGTQTLTLSGNGTSGLSSGALEAINGGATVAGNIVLAGNATVSSVFSSSNFTFAGLTLSGGISGAGRTLTVTGPSNTTIGGVIGTTTGGLVKTGRATLTLSGASANTFTGATVLNGGELMTNANGLAGGGTITFGGGILGASSGNSTNYGSRIVSSSGPITIDTTNNSMTLSGIASSNKGGLAKFGSNSLTLSGTNSYSGVTVVNGGALTVSTVASLPGSVFIDKAGSLNSGSAYTGVQGWLNSGVVSNASTGDIALTGNSSENINFNTGGYSGLMLGATSNATYTGTLTAAGTTYRLGGGGATLTLSGTNALTGSNSLVVGAVGIPAYPSGGSALTSSGTVAITGANNMSGPTTLNAGSLAFSGAGALTNSAITINPGTTLSFTTINSTPITRAASVTLNGASDLSASSSAFLYNTAFNVSGGTTANSTDIITGALSSGSSFSTVTLTAGSKNTDLTVGSLVHNAGGVLFIRGTSLGQGALLDQDGGISNIVVTTPNLVGGGGVADGNAVTTSPTVGILVGVYGDTTSNGNGSTLLSGGLLTYDSVYGVRPLSTGGTLLNPNGTANSSAPNTTAVNTGYASEYNFAITNGQTELDNVLYNNMTGSVFTQSLTSNTTINSLSFNATSATGNNHGVTLSGTGTTSLTINSGVIYDSDVNITGHNSTDAFLISVPTLNFGSAEGMILQFGSNTSGGSNGDSSGLTITSSIAGSNGLTLSGGNGTSFVIFGGATSNVYTGTTTIDGATLALGKTGGAVSIPGNLVLNSGNVYDGGSQFAATSNVTVNGGNFLLNPSANSGSPSSDTFTSLTLNGGTVNYGGTRTGSLHLTGALTINGGNMAANTDGVTTVDGAANIGGGGVLYVEPGSTSTVAAQTANGVAAFNGGLTITNTTSGAYTPISIIWGTPTTVGGKLLLNSNLTFVGNSTNTNTALIEAIAGPGMNGTVALTGSRTFNIGDGAAAIDLAVTAPIVDGNTAGSLTKTGAGALALLANSTYTGGTTASAGQLYINNGGGASYTAPATSAARPITATNSGSGTGTGSVTVASGGTLGGSGTIAATSGGVTVQSGGVLASGALQTANAYANGGTGSVNGTGTGGGLTINNAANLSSALTVNGGATLTFALGSSTTYNGGSGFLNFANPNTNSTYLSLTGSTADLIFSNTLVSDTINLVDLTVGSPSGGVALTLRAQNPYLLIQTALGDNSDFANLWTTGGEGQNGYVLGVSTGVGNNYTAFNYATYDINGNLISSPTNLENVRLYLFNGDLEVVPEPGTWALMLGGLALLVVIQRRKNQKV